MFMCIVVRSGKMSVITKVPEHNIFEAICKEFSSFKQLQEDDETSIATDYQDYDPAKHNPVFYGRMHYPLSSDADPHIDAALVHPSIIGYVFTDKPPKSASPPPSPIPEKDKCSPRQYLELYVFPTLLPALEEMLKQAKIEKCFERKRTKFDALDFLTEYLYNNNQNGVGRSKSVLNDIPFVQDWLRDHPRPPLPLSLIWTEEEAVLKIQAFWKGYLVRRDAEVQELRQWQAEWRVETGIHRHVSDFWEKKMPENTAKSQETENTAKSQETGNTSKSQETGNTDKSQENLDNVAKSSSN